jgi:folate-binding protein YgfZ
MTVELNGVAPLPHLGVIRVQGADATSFLQGQLTQDVALLPAGQARLAAYCTAKGRMLASFVLVKAAPDDFLLVCSRDLLPTVLKKLSMFVLRAKAKLTDASADWALRGVAGEPLRAMAPHEAQPWSATRVGAAFLVALYPAAGQARALWLAPAGEASPAGPELAPELWRWSEAASGVATVSTPVVEAFVPQMLNYESVGGVNFKKGCYPGQEVVARSQFRGAIKRRAFVAHADAELTPGQEIFQAADPEQPAGLVVQAAPSPQGGWDAIVSLQLAAAEAGGLHVGAADGPPVQLQPLPYSLLVDV